MVPLLWAPMVPLWCTTGDPVSPFSAPTWSLSCVRGAPGWFPCGAPVVPLWCPPCLWCGCSPPLLLAPAPVVRPSVRGAPVGPVCETPVVLLLVPDSPSACLLTNRFRCCGSPVVPGCQPVDRFFWCGCVCLVFFRLSSPEQVG